MTLLGKEWSPGGIRHEAHVDEETSELVIHRMQNVSPILDYNAFLRSLGSQHYKGEDGTMWHYARIPIAVLEQLIQKYGSDVVFNDNDDTIIKYIEREAPWLKCGEFSLA